MRPAAWRCVLSIPTPLAPLLNVYSQNGRSLRGLACYTRHASRERRVLGSDHPSIITSCRNISLCIFAAGAQEAAQCVSDCLQLRWRWVRSMLKLID